MARPRLSRREGDFLRRSRVVRLATVDGEGQPHCVPVSPQWDGEALFFATEKDTKKVRNMRTNPRVCAVADLYDDDWDKNKGLVLQGKARIVGPGEEFKKYKRGLTRKYELYRLEEYAPTEETDFIVVIRPTHVFSWGV
jgi:PPOX class probable F420-dependent enzyme